MPPQQILDVMVVAMDDVGQKFQRNEIFVPEMLIAARAMKESMAALEPLLVAAGIKPVAKVIIGTVDMIGSGLLFSRYTVGFKLRPHHAAFLAQDVLLVHDEAHLEPAFQKLLGSIVEEQSRSNDFRKLRVMELSATTRSGALTAPLLITEDDKQNDFVQKRLNAVKILSLMALGENEKEQDKRWPDKTMGEAVRPV